LINDAGLVPVFSGPFFNEFALSVTGWAERRSRFFANRIVPGIALSEWYPELPDTLLICVTEMNEEEEIEQLVRTFSGR
jgi:glycine dehydrogenase subunit 1